MFISEKQKRQGKKATSTIKSWAQLTFGSA